MEIVDANYWEFGNCGVPDMDDNRLSLFPWRLKGRIAPGRLLP